MNWKSEAIGKLKKYDAMRTSMDLIPKEIARLESEYAAIRSASTDGTPIRGGTSTREDALINNIVERQELAAALASATDWVQIVERGLSCLSAEEQKILQRIYIYPEKKAVLRLSEEMNLDQTNIYRRRDKALTLFTLALYGATGEEL